MKAQVFGRASHLVIGYTSLHFTAIDDAASPTKTTILYPLVKRQWQVVNHGNATGWGPQGCFTGLRQ